MIHPSHGTPSQVGELDPRKLKRKTLPVTVSSIKDNLFDVAGIRVICNYRDDVYSVSNYLSAQNDISVLRVKDYIKNPKQNGYRSLHVIYAVPVFLSSGAHYTPVEVQFRTIAMDYWASLEHALRYKTDLPDAKLAEHSQTLLDCARSLQNIETQMQNIHRDINGAPQVEETPKATKLVESAPVTHPPPSLTGTDPSDGRSAGFCLSCFPVAFPDRVH